MECTHTFNFYSWLITTEIYDLTACAAQTLNKFRPLLIYERYLQNLKLPPSLPAYHVMFYTSRDQTISFCPTDGSFLSATFFPLFYQSLLLFKND